MTTLSKIKRHLIQALLVLTPILQASAQQHHNLNKTLADSLSKWVITDQIAAGVPQGRYKELGWAKFNEFKDSVFGAHQTLLSKIFRQYGYPGYDLVGKKGSNDFWLMVQHCDKYPDFQKRVLTAMKKEVDKGNADPKNFAYLTDRVKLNTGEKQVYGTQLTYNTDSCQAIPRPLADSLSVNKRRKDVGLAPIEEYLNDMSEMHFEMNKEIYLKKGITKPKLLKVPSSASY